MLRELGFEAFLPSRFWRVVESRDYYKAVETVDLDICVSNQDLYLDNLWQLVGAVKHLQMASHLFYVHDGLALEIICMDCPNHEVAENR